MDSIKDFILLQISLVVLSVKFFNESAKSSDVIGFIIPKAWKKWTVINRLNNNFHLAEQFEMSKVCFYSEELGPYENKHLNTLFQIWKKENSSLVQAIVRERQCEVPIISKYH